MEEKVTLAIIASITIMFVLGMVLTHIEATNICR